MLAVSLSKSLPSGLRFAVETLLYANVGVPMNAHNRLESGLGLRANPTVRRTITQKTSPFTMITRQSEAARLCNHIGEKATLPNVANWCSFAVRWLVWFAGCVVAPLRFRATSGAVRRTIAPCECQPNSLFQFMEPYFRGTYADSIHFA
jgi:hypothetical protein